MPELKAWQRHRYQPEPLFEVRRAPACEWCDHVAPLVYVPADKATAQGNGDNYFLLCESCRLRRLHRPAGGRAA